jgi:CubicO group peptidase (beta-lactamase class C family)
MIMPLSRPQEIPMPLSRPTSFVAALMLAAPAAQAAAVRPRPAEALASLDALVQQALADQKIPGATVGVVVGDEVVLLKGYGLRDRERNLPMTPDTLMPIASITKQFTVASLGTLVRQGKLDWDKPVRDYLPDFRVNDDVATLRATPRDLVTHRIGLPRHDGLWFGSTLTRQELYGRLQYLPFSRDLRTTFQYNNLMYMTAGLLGGRIAGSSWEQLVKTALFDPLGMKRSSFTLKELGADPDHARGYQLDEKRDLVPDPYESAETMGPTGGINSSAREMTGYLRMMLAGGQSGGTRVLQAADVAAMMQPNTPISGSPFPEFGYGSYGMGLFVNTYRGIEYASHGGNMPGAAAVVLMVPKEKIGVVVLTNRSGARLRDGLPFEIVDRLMGLPSAGLVARYGELEQKALAGEEAAKAGGVSDQRKGTSPAHALADYAADYAHPGYGTVGISLADGRLQLAYNGFKTPLDHWHYEVFRAPDDRGNRLEQTRVRFETDLEGEVSTIEVPMEPNVPPTVFTRTAPAEMTSRPFLTSLVGVYEVNGIDAEVLLREDGVLLYVVLGRARELVPVRGTLFRVKDLTGVSVEFLKDASGRVDRIALHADSSTVGPRKK